jgi:hypothetical protein
LDDRTVKLLVQWIEMGAPWPNGDAPHPTPGDPTGFDWRKRKEAHWAWQPLRHVAVPQPDGDSWSHGPVDRFVLQAMHERGLDPAPEADRSTLVRRAHFDLIGLPPSVEQLHYWQQQTDHGWYERMIDQLLASPHFGEKWGRHWLDLVRYAETCGHEFDYPIAFAHRYRDYVIRAWNQDIPYDQLVREHLAGDLLLPARRHPSGFNESIIGTGFWFLGESVHSPTDVRADEADRIDNQIDVMGKTFLGLTVGCARCHDHKFDPIPTDDYYALAGFLQSSRRQIALLDPQGVIEQNARQIDQVRRQADQRQLSRWSAENGKGLAADLQPLREMLAQYAPEKDESVVALRGVPPKLVAAAAARWGAAPERLRAWTDALGDRGTDDPSHPLFFVRELIGVEDARFAQQAQQLGQRVLERQKQVRSATERMECFADFAVDLESWRATGQAFSDQPTSGSEIDWWCKPVQWTLPGLAHSGLRGRRKQGVLRSPTFELNHRQIHYRMQGRDVQIRLIVDGYFMDQFNQLLFADCTLEDVDTGDDFVWVTQSKDLEHYLGHRAHIEIHDRGNGYAAVDQIWFSDGPAPPAAPHAWSLHLAGNPPTTWQSLVEQVAALFRQTCSRLEKGMPAGGDIQVANHMVRHRLQPADQEFAVTGILSDKTDNRGGPEDSPEFEHDLAAGRSLLMQLDSRTPEPMQALAITDGSGENERVHIRGNPGNLGAEVPRRMLVALAGADQAPVGHGSGRLELADRMTDPANPLLSRVIVNRLWHHLFGRGIVASVDDFGVMGQMPTHPDLLDWLAADLVEHGWSLKQTIRAVVTSRTYKMASTADDPLNTEHDPQNLWLSRAPVRRLTAEAIRDSILTISGRIDYAMFGESVPTFLTPFMTGRGRPKSGPRDGDGRRSIYLEVRRNFLSPLMLTFDAPIPFNTMGRRAVSNVPAQSLVLMNDPFVHQQAQRWAERLLALPLSDSQRVDRMFLAALARKPADQERAAVIAFLELQKQRHQTPNDVHAVWTDLCHAMFNMKEFIYLR